jgi:hypothetical protein
MAGLSGVEDTAAAVACAAGGARDSVSAWVSSWGFSLKVSGMDGAAGKTSV